MIDKDLDAGKSARTSPPLAGSVHQPVILHIYQPELENFQIKAESNKFI